MGGRKLEQQILHGLQQPPLPDLRIGAAFLFGDFGAPLGCRFLMPVHLHIRINIPPRKEPAQYESPTVDPHPRHQSEPPPLEQPRHLVVPLHRTPSGFYQAPSADESAHDRSPHGKVASRWVTQTERAKSMRSVTNNIFDQASIEQMNRHYVHTAGRFFQMFAGTSSELMSIEDEIFHLEIHTLVAKESPDFHRLVRNVAKSWQTVFSRVFQARGFSAHIYRTHHPKGFIVGAEDKPQGQLIKGILEWTKEAARPSADILLAVVCEEYASRD